MEMVRHIPPRQFGVSAVNTIAQRTRSDFAFATARDLQGWLEIRRDELAWARTSGQPEWFEITTVCKIATLRLMLCQRIAREANA